MSVVCEKIFLFLCSICLRTTDESYFHQIDLAKIFMHLHYSTNVNTETLFKFWAKLKGHPNRNFFLIKKSKN